MTVIGIDVSKWNGNWDARKARAAGAQFVFIKSSQATFTDPRFAENWKKAREAGLLRGAYHYLDYTKPAAEQSRYFLDILKSEPGELSPVVDFEQPSDSNPNLPLGYLRQFVEHMLEQEKTPIIYTSPAFWKSYGESATYWYQFPLWIANYTLAAAPIVPPPWLSWEFWQFSKKGPGQLFGSEALDIDVNRFNGSLEELHLLSKRQPKASINERVFAIEARLASIEKYLNGLPGTTEPEELSAGLPSEDILDVPEPVIEEPVTASATATVIKDRAPVYLGPFTALPPISHLDRNAQVEITEQNGQWAKITSPPGWVDINALQSTAEAELDDGEYMVCKAQALNVRAGPGANSPVVGWLEKGQRIKILDRNNGWVQMESPAGWSMEAYLGTP